MFFSSHPIRTGFLCTSIAALRISRTHTNAGVNYAPLIIPNTTDWTLIANAATPVNETTILPEPTSTGGDIIWPESYASPKVFTSPKAVSSSKPSPGAPKFSCNGKAYGKNLKYASCVEALAKLPDSQQSVTFGDRGHGDWNANLPIRVLSFDGLCALDVNHATGAYSDEITPTELKESAGLLIDICVKNSPNTGGVVSNIGKKGNLAVRVTPYRPNVRCGPYGSAPPAGDCRNLLDQMPADGTKQILGPKNDPNPEITVKLPSGFKTNQHRCQLVIDSLVPGDGKDTSDWYKLWAVACAIEFMCVHTGRSGMALNVGEKKSLYVEITDMARPDHDSVAAPLLAVS